MSEEKYEAHDGFDVEDFLPVAAGDGSAQGRVGSAAEGDGDLRKDAEDLHGEGQVAGGDARPAEVFENQERSLAHDAGQGHEDAHGDGFGEDSLDVRKIPRAGRHGKLLPQEPVSEGDLHPPDPGVNQDDGQGIAPCRQGGKAKDDLQRAEDCLQPEGKAVRFECGEHGQVPLRKGSSEHREGKTGQNGLGLRILFPDQDRSEEGQRRDVGGHFPQRQGTSQQFSAA